MKKNNIQVIMGTARLTAKKTVQVTAADGKMQEISADNSLLATGSHAAMIPGITSDGEKVVTYYEAILQEKLPKSVVIIGAGALGLEFATVWSAYGTEVTLVEMMPRIAPMEDEEISQELEKQFTRRGIKIFTDSKAMSVKTTASGVSVTISGKEGEKTFEAEQTLVATGFKPNVENAGLEEAGVKLNERKFIEVNEKMATNVPGIYAIGDVTGKFLLAHVASKQGILCAEAIAGKETQPIDYVMVPRATFCQPQVASFGYTEAQAREKGLEIKIGKFPFQPNGKALGMGETAGFVKIITDSKYGEILGAHLIGPEVSELLPELTLAQKNELTIEEIADNIHVHPTLNEAVMEAAEVNLERGINI
jgi:dihydrolipoamide dehydrogenase